MRNRQGFTLIELLVVVAIIALLIAILLPSLGKARTLAKTSQCLSNTRSMGQSVQFYVADWNTMLPFNSSSANGAGSWTQILMFGSSSGGANANTGSGYGASNKLRICPEASTPVTMTMDTVGDAHHQWVGNSLTGLYTSSYGMNGWIYEPAAGSDSGSQSMLSSALNNSSTDYALFYKIAKANRSSEIPVFADCNWRHVWPYPADQAGTSLVNNGPSDTSNPKHRMQRLVMNRHNTKAINVSFVDGHGETVKLPLLWTLQWYSGWISPSSLPTIPLN
jgi:prepilin-type N-terminal cleavage/methylation domain-containing protein/prepilin-type processing-associated H-X9-DG protein